MEENQLISKIQLLKQIKPRKEWVVLVKRDIIRDSFIDIRNHKSVKYKELLSNIFNSFFQRKFAYAFSALLIIFLSISLLNNYIYLPKGEEISKESVAALVEVKDNVEVFKTSSRNLAEIATTKSDNVSLAISEVKNAALGLTDKIKKDPELAKSVALEINNNKTFLDVVEGDDLKESLHDLYKVTVDSMIESYDQTTLTSKQKEELERIKNNLFENGNYISALEDILLMMNSGI